MTSQPPLLRFLEVFNDFHNACMNESHTAQRRDVAQLLAEHGDAAIATCTDLEVRRIIATITHIAKNYRMVQNAAWEINQHWPGLNGMILASMHGTDASKSPKSGETEGNSTQLLSLEPGRVAYKGHSVDLRGKPWKVVQALHLRRGAMTLNQLRDSVWGSESVSGEEAIRSAISSARSALRRLFKMAGEPVDDPIKNIDRGDANTAAWRLELPENP